MRSIVLLLALSALGGCSWETYQTADGHTSLRQKYEPGTPVYYQDGSYSRNMKYNQFRPEQRAITRNSDAAEVRGTNWKKPGAPTQEASAPEPTEQVPADIQQQ